MGVESKKKFNLYAFFSENIGDIASGCATITMFCFVASYFVDINDFNKEEINADDYQNVKRFAVQDIESPELSAMRDKAIKEAYKDGVITYGEFIDIKKVKNEIKKQEQINNAKSELDKIYK